MGHAVNDTRQSVFGGEIFILRGKKLRVTFAHIKCSTDGSAVLVLIYALFEDTVQCHTLDGIVGVDCAVAVTGFVDRSVDEGFIRGVDGGFCKAIVSVVLEGFECRSVALFTLDIAKPVVSIIIHYIRTVVNSFGQLAKLIVLICNEGFCAAGDYYLGAVFGVVVFIGCNIVIMIKA